MKTIIAVIAIAFLIVTGVMVSLIQKGGALKPAGVIKPQEVGNDPELIGKEIAIRLFPDFQETKRVIWRLEAEELKQVPATVLAHYRGTVKPSLEENCTENCWFIVSLEAPVPESSLPTAEIFVQYFDRDMEVPEVCQNQKMLTLECMKPISAREVRRKIKTPARHFFMQRYKQEQFYLFIERKGS